MHRAAGWCCCTRSTCACGVAILYSLMIALAATSVWLGRNQTLYDFWFYITNFSRYPMEIYHRGWGTPLRGFFTFVIPVLVVVNVPARLLAQPLHPRAWWEWPLAGFAVVASIVSLLALALDLLSGLVELSQRQQLNGLEEGWRRESRGESLPPTYGEVAVTDPHLGQFRSSKLLAYLAVAASAQRLHGGGGGDDGGSFCGRAGERFRSVPLAVGGVLPAVHGRRRAQRRLRLPSGRSLAAPPSLAVGPHRSRLGDAAGIRHAGGRGCSGLAGRLGPSPSRRRWLGEAASWCC